MFGFDRMSNQQYNQIPYEVYETVHEPEARRRRWFVRLGAALAVVTLLIVGGVFVQRAFFKDDAKDQQTAQSDNQGSTGSSTAQNNVKPTDAVVQSPQQNVPLPTGGSGSGVQPNDSQNNSTVRKPE